MDLLLLQSSLGKTPCVTQKVQSVLEEVNSLPRQFKSLEDLTTLSRVRSKSLVADRAAIIILRGRGGVIDQIRSMRPVVSILEDDFV